MCPSADEVYSRLRKKGRRDLDSPSLCDFVIWEGF
jgi:hypothetical protein